MWFLFGEVSSSLWVLAMGYVILLWHSLSLPYNYFDEVTYYRITKRMSNGYKNARNVYQVMKVVKVVVEGIAEGVRSALSICVLHRFLTSNGQWTVY